MTSVTVTARLTSPDTNGWLPLTDGWEEVADDATRATLTVTLVAGRCDAATPVVTFDPPECVDGVALPARVTPVIPTDGVTYEPAEAFAVRSVGRRR